MKRARSHTGASVPLVLVLALTMGVACSSQYRIPTPDPVTLRFAYRQGVADFQPLLEAFRETRPWITVEAVEVQGWAQRRIDLLIQGGEVDIFHAGRQALAYVESDLLRPLDDIQLGDWAPIRDDYYGGAWESLSILGQQWAVPAGLDMLVCYMNAAAAEGLKVGVPETPWTLPDFLELVSKMNHPEGLPNAEGPLFGFCSMPQTMDPLAFVYLHGGRIVDDINSPSIATLDDAKTIEAVQWYADLYSRHEVVPNPRVIEQTFPRAGITEAQMRGACGVWLGWYSAREGTSTRYRWDFEWKMLPLPKDQAEFGLGDAEGYFITKDCAHPKEALELIRFLSDHWQAAGKRVPPRRSLTGSKEYEQAVGKEVAAIARSFSDRVIITPVSSEMDIVPSQSAEALQLVGMQMLAAIQAIIDEDLEAADVLPEAQQRARAVFQSQ